MHNSKVYQIDDISFELTPKSHYFTWTNFDNKTCQKTELKTNVVEYFKLKWNIEIPEREQDQPLLIVFLKSDKILLPASLCFESSLPKDFTKDTKKMKDLHQYKITNPDVRLERIQSIMSKLKGAKELEKFGITLQESMTNVKARQLFHPKILDSARNKPFDWQLYENQKA